MAVLTRIEVRIAAVVLFLGGLLGAWLSPTPFTTTTPALRILPSLPFTDVNPIGANFFLDREVEQWKKEQTVRMAREAGVGWMKQIFAWEEIEPRKGYFFDDKFRKPTWEKYDQIVDLAQQNGLRIIARLDRPPVWARPPGANETAPPSNFQDYGDFVKAVVEHYKGRVQYFQIWNEPNLGVEWTGRPDAAGYADLLKVAYTRAKEADPNVVILSAPLAQTLEESPANLTELKYMEALYKAGAGPYFDILSANAYGFEFPADAAPDPKVLNFSRLQLMRQVMEQAGDANKPIWFNEFGWNASPATMPIDKLIWRRVSDDQQAQYTVDAIKLSRQWGWVGVLNLWFFRQVGDIPADRSDYYFRMVDTDFTPRPLYLQVKALHDQIGVATAGEYEETAAPAELRGPWQTLQRDGASGGRMAQTAGDGAVATFTISGTGLALVVPAGPDPIRLSVKVDGAQNQSAVDLPTGKADMTSVHIAKGLTPGPHTIEVERVSGPAFGFDRFLVEFKPDFTVFYLLSGTAMLALAVLLASFAVRTR